MVGATDRQLAVLTAIRDSIVRNGYPPTIRELCGALGIHSTNGINDHVGRLRAKGLVVQEYATARGLRITPDGDALLAKRAPFVPAQPMVDDLVEVPVFANLVPGNEEQKTPLRLSKHLLHGARDPFGYELRSGGSGFLPGDVLLAGEVEDPRGVRPVIAVLGDVLLVAQMSINHAARRRAFRPIVGNLPPVAVDFDSFDPSMIIGTVVALWRTAG